MRLLFGAFQRRKSQLTKIRIAALVAACLTSYIQAARAADLPIKTRNSHESATDRVRLSPIAKEILFEEFLEWLKKRDQVILRSSFLQ
jgi:hypothetical protein